MAEIKETTTMSFCNVMLCNTCGRRPSSAKTTLADREDSVPLRRSLQHTLPPRKYRILVKKNIMLQMIIRPIIFTLFFSTRYWQNFLPDFWKESFHGRASCYTDLKPRGVSRVSTVRAARLVSGKQPSQFISPATCLPQTWVAAQGKSRYVALLRFRWAFP